MICRQDTRHGVAAMYVIGQGVDEQYKVYGLKFEAVKIRPPASFQVDHMGDHTVNLIAIALFGEFVAKLPDQVPDEIKSFGATCEKGPIDGIQAMVFAIGPHHRRCIVPRVRGHRDEPYPITHGRLIDHSLNLGDVFGMQGADIGTIGIDKIQHDDLAAQVRRRISAAGCIPQGEDRRLFVERLEVFLPFVELLFQTPQRMGRDRRRAAQCQHGAQANGD